jgi:anaerobic dimethyl sulfoxide reductase subunit A
VARFTPSRTECFPLDAQKRGIKNGDRVRIYNGRGEVHIEAKVTPRILPGVVALGEQLFEDFA